MNNKKVTKTKTENSDIKVETEIIVLSHFKNRNYDERNIYFPSPYVPDEESLKRMKEEEEEIEIQKRLKIKVSVLHIQPTYIKDEEIEKENIQKTELFVRNSLSKYYKIEKNKIIENFCQLKLKVYLKDIHIISNEKILTIDLINEPQQSHQINFGNNNTINNNHQPTKQKIKIYDSRFFTLLNEIEVEKDFWTKYQNSHSNTYLNTKIYESTLSAIELDNKDLVISSYNNKVLKINVYQYENNNYIIYRKIYEKINGYESETCNTYNKIKKLSGNRFMTTSNNIIKIYSLNNINRYDIILSHDFRGIKEIYEINENDFIICSLNSFIKERIHDFKQTHLNRIPVYHFINYEFCIKKIAINNFKPSYKEININIFPDQYIILKSKYFLVGLNNSDCIHIFSLNNGRLLKRYDILENIEKNTNLYKINNFRIYKWNCSDDDEFIINAEGNITLFRLLEKENEMVDLEIIGYSYIDNSNPLIKMNENNKFYIQYNDYILIY